MALWRWSRGSVRSTDRGQLRLWSQVVVQSYLFREHVQLALDASSMT